MSRKRCHRRPITPLPPLGLRRKLDKSQLQDLGLAHIANLDAISHGRADEQLLWQWIAGALTWSYVAGALEKRDAVRYRAAAIAMRLQLEVATAVVDRFGRTGRVGFSGPEYLQAKDAVEWMDALAEMVDQPTASRAADWSEMRVNKWLAECKRREEQAV